jgi:Flp pilus assembly protein TadD/ferredoxin
VRVHEEVALYGMVVDPGCMKCMDCVSVCPNDALYWGVGKPSLGAKPVSPRKAVPYDFTLAEEAWMTVVGFVALVIYRGLYGQIPLLMAMGMAAITAYGARKLARLFRDANVRLQNLSLKRGDRLSKAGWAFAGVMVLWLALTAHGGVVQYLTWRGRSLSASLNVSAGPLAPDVVWWEQASADQRATLDRAIDCLRRADRWGLISSAPLLADWVNLERMKGDLAEAERIGRRLVALEPKNAYAYAPLGNVLRTAGRWVEAEEIYRQAVEVNPASESAREELCHFLLSFNRPHDVVTVFDEHVLRPRDANWAADLAAALNRSNHLAEAEHVLTRAIEVAPRQARLHWLLGVARARQGKAHLALSSLQQAAALDPDAAEIHYDLAYQHLALQQTAPAIGHLQQAIRLKPEFADAHYQMGVALLMAGRSTESVPYVREAVHHNPNDPQYHEFLAFLLQQQGDEVGAREALEAAGKLRERNRERL